jgi:valyl-tRNA synthetase
MNRPVEKTKTDINYEKDIFDVWIHSRFNSTLKTFVQALENYRINEASKALYDFVWRDFCDWYIEALKIKAGENTDSANRLYKDALNLFENILKMLHPVMPFITEELWQSLEARKADESISVSKFPVLDETRVQAEIEKEFEELQDLTTAIRNLRSEINLSPSVKCDVIIACHSYEDVQHVAEVEHYLKVFARINHLDVILADDFSKRPKIKSVTSVVGQFQVYIKVEGLIDIEQEKQRLQKEISRVESFVNNLEKKLQNKKFIDKAAPSVVENERKKYNDNVVKLEKLNLSLNSLQE